MFQNMAMSPSSRKMVVGGLSTSSVESVCMCILHLHPFQLLLCLLMNESLKHGGFVMLYYNQSMDKHPAGATQYHSRVLFSLLQKCCRNANNIKEYHLKTVLFVQLQVIILLEYFIDISLHDQVISLHFLLRIIWNLKRYLMVYTGEPCPQSFLVHHHSETV